MDRERSGAEAGIVITSGAPKRHWPKSHVEHGSPAVFRPAPACISLALFLAGAAFIDREPVVVVQLFPRLDSAHGINEYPVIVFLDRLAVRIATVIDPARGIAVDARIDDLAIAQPEDEGVVRIIRITWRSAERFLPTRALALIFDDSRALANLASRESAMAMGAGKSDDVKRFGF